MNFKRTLVRQNTADCTSQRRLKHHLPVEAMFQTSVKKLTTFLQTNQSATNGKLLPRHTFWRF